MSSRLLFTKPFVRDYQELPEEIQKEVDKALRLLLDNPRHPSLRTKKMQPKGRGIFEARVTQGYRMTFQVNPPDLVMRRVGTHDILRSP